MLNRQQPYGADVISRVSATMLDENALGALEARAHETLSQLAGEVCEEAGVPPHEVYEIVVFGNVTMTQLALGIDPEPLSMAPFIVASHDLPPALASDFGVAVHPRAPAAVFPSLGAYVGGDIVAGMLATGLTRDKRVRLFIDVGTNSEIALGSTSACWPRPRRPALPSRPPRSAAACVPPRGDRGREHPDGELDAPGDRRHRPGRACAAPGWSTASPRWSGRPARPLRPLHGRPPNDEDRRGAGVHARRQRLPVPARRPRAAVRQGLDRHRLEDPVARDGARSTTSRRCCWPAASARTCRRPARCGSGSCRARSAAHRVRRKRGRRGRQDGRAVPRERAEARSILDEVEYVELSGRDDFNDMFIDQLAFPG